MTRHRCKMTNKWLEQQRLDRINAGTVDRKTEDVGDMWHAANVAFSAEERESYNKWRSALMLAYYQLSDALESIPIHAGSDGERQKRVFQKLCAIRAIIKESPDLMTE